MRSFIVVRIDGGGSFDFRLPHMGAEDEKITKTLTWTTQPFKLQNVLLYGPEMVGLVLLGAPDGAAVRV